MSKDIPIIFSAPMVRALLEGRKTMTRRIIKPQPVPFMIDEKPCDVGSMQIDGDPRARVTLGRVITKQELRYAVGDRLWVRENLCRGEFLGIKQNVSVTRYSADEAEVLNEDGFNLLPWWKGKGGLPSIHMPRSASRLTLIVTGLKIERLRDISEADVLAEGVVRFKSGDTEMFGIRIPGAYEHPGLTPRETFQNLWCTLHGPHAWNDNPFVVAISYRVIKANIDAPEARLAA